MKPICYGLKNCHFKTLGMVQPAPIPGAVKLIFNPKSDFIFKNISTVHGIWEIPVGIKNDTYSADFEIACLPDIFLEKIFGYKKSGEMYIEYPQNFVRFSLYFETNIGDKKLWKKYFNCVCQKPNFDVTTIAGDSISADTRKLKLFIFPNLSNGALSSFITSGDGEPDDIMSLLD